MTNANRDLDSYITINLEFDDEECFLFPTRRTATDQEIEYFVSILTTSEVDRLAFRLGVEAQERGRKPKNAKKKKSNCECGGCDESY